MKMKVITVLMLILFNINHLSAQAKKTVSGSWINPDINVQIDIVEIDEPEDLPYIKGRSREFRYNILHMQEQFPYNNTDFPLSGIQVGRKIIFSLPDVVKLEGHIWVVGILNKAKTFFTALHFHVHDRECFEPLITTLITVHGNEEPALSAECYISPSTLFTEQLYPSSWYKV